MVNSIVQLNEQSESNYKHGIPDRRLDTLISRLVIFDGCRMVGTLSHSNVAYTLTDMFYFH
jgi:hypothetical protein